MNVCGPAQFVRSEFLNVILPFLWYVCSVSMKPLRLQSHSNGFSPRLLDKKHKLSLYNGKGRVNKGRCIKFFVGLYTSCERYIFSTEIQNRFLGLDWWCLRVIVGVDFCFCLGWGSNFRVKGGAVRNVNKHFVYILNHYINFLKISETVRIFYSILARYSSKWILARVYVQKNKKHAKFEQFKLRSLLIFMSRNDAQNGL